MIDQFKISIITVSYNAAHTIEQTISSVVNQTYPNIEYIIIDGGSTDGTLDIIKKHQDKIAYWVTEPDKGIYDAMNKGIDVATGDYIYFLGADDCLVDYFVIGEIACFLNNNKIGVFSALVWSVDEEHGVQLEYSNRFSLQDIYRGYRIPHQGTLLRSDILRKYYFDCRFKIVADYDLFLKLYFDQNISFYYSKRKIAFYSTGGMSSLNTEKRALEDIKVMHEHGISQKYIDLYKTQFFSDWRNLKNKIKWIMFYLFSKKYFLLQQGWKIHQCDIEKCRWCKNRKMKND